MLTSLGIKSTFIETLLPLAMIGAGMGIFASPNRASIMNSVPRYQRGIAAGTSTMFVLSGSTLSVGLAFLIMSHTIPLNYIESIFLGTIETTTKGNIKSSNNNNNSPKSVSTTTNFLSSLHYIFLLSAILMLISIIPSWITVGNNKNNNHNNNN
jgi:hypothetical protein